MRINKQGYKVEMIELTEEQAEKLKKIEQLAYKDYGNCSLMAQVFPEIKQADVLLLPSNAAHAVKKALDDNAANPIEVPEPEIRGHMHNVEPSQMSEVGVLPELRFTFDMDQFRKDTQAIYDGLHNAKGTFIKNAMAKAAKELTKPAPKKLSWIQKIRGYNDLQARCNSSESMRDHYKTALESWESLAISKSRELELMEKVADNWQQRLIDQNAIIGKRLKFSVGTYRITIVVGNPVTACYFTYPNVVMDCDEEFLAVSICHKNDQFDWKRGVIESLENMIGSWLGNAYGDTSLFYNALFTAYPELEIQPVVKPVKKTKKSKKATK